MYLLHFHTIAQIMQCMANLISKTMLFIYPARIILAVQDICSYITLFLSLQYKMYKKTKHEK
jgi:hypothetical protein